MPSFRTTRPVRHTPSQMFELVADVERYPEFLPLCEGLKVRRRVASGDGVESLVAEMRVG
ncbi:MAG: SRPBCC family protein, partial [Microvirga sp.]